MNRLKFFILLTLLVVMSILPCGIGQRDAQAVATLNPAVDLSKPNFAYSPTTIRKFVDSLPGIGVANNLSQELPLATANKTTFPGSDYYEIALVEYREQLHSNLPAVSGVWPAAQTGGTKLRGYVQEVDGVASTIPHYLGPIILATKNRPVRIKFTNRLPATGAGGNLFLPVDTTIMGAGMGPLTAAGAVCDPSLPSATCASYPENRAAIHLHGGIPPWISDGTPHQWITPAAEVTPFVKGASQQNVPDMWYDSTTTNIIPACAGQLTCATGGATKTPAGVATFYWTNQQSGRLMFYHDHALGITRLNVYAGEAAGYLVVDPTEESALLGRGVSGTIVTNSTTGAIESEDLAHLIPLVIQDKTFVSANLALPAANVLNTDPLWKDNPNWGGTGDLWFPHVYMPNQDPTDLSGANPLGRWDYGPWFWPVFPVASSWPPTVSHVPESFMDTPVVNGTAYPHVNVAAAPYRLRILNASNDRMLNLQLYSSPGAGATATATVGGGIFTDIILGAGGAGYTIAPGVFITGGGGTGATATATIAAGAVNGFVITNPGSGYTSPPTVTIAGTEVKMVPATPTTICADPNIPNVPSGCFPESWAVQTPGMIPDILDSRPSGVPDPALRGPAMIQIGTEGGLLPGPALLLNTPVGFEQNKRNIVVLNVLEKTLFMAPAERADVIVDFTNFAGKTIILYNDSPAPVPAGDPRYDFYTGNLDYSATGGANNQGGAPSTLAGYGPNTRTIMQFRVAGSGGTAPLDDYNPALLSALQNTTTGLPAIFKASQDAPIVPESAYNGIGYTGGSTTDTFARIQNLSLTFTPYGSTAPITMAMKNKTIQELFDTQGRMNSTLGVELPFTGALIQTTVPLGYIDPVTETLRAGETQLWKITHNGVDTHVIHFHLVNVQIINRVGWDGAIRPIDKNELGWKESIRMNPLEDIIVAMRARVPTYPFPVPNSIRLLNPAMPEGSTFASLNPLTGAPITVTNAMTNFGHEYTWHCHILGHEENDMMRPIILLNQHRLVWANTSGEETLWTLDDSENYASQKNYGPFTGWSVQKDYRHPDGTGTLLWLNTSGEIALWTIDASDNYVSQENYGPFADWTVLNYYRNLDGTRKLLWTNTSGEIALWTIDASDYYVSQKNYGPFADWTLQNYLRNSDGTGKLVWLNTSGQIALWTLDASDNYVSQKNYGPFAGFSLLSGNYYRNPDGTGKLVWLNTSGQIALWTLDASDNYVSQKNYGPFAGWTAQKGYRHADGTGTIRWLNTSGQIALWTLDASDNYVSQANHGPVAGSTVLDYYRKEDGTRKLIWNAGSGAASLWTLDASDNLIGSKAFGPYSGWTVTNYQ